jgi:hypothetical protein
MMEGSVAYLPRKDCNFVSMLYKPFDESLADWTHAAGNCDDGHD